MMNHWFFLLLLIMSCTSVSPETVTPTIIKTTSQEVVRTETIAPLLTGISTQRTTNTPEPTSFYFVVKPSTDVWVD